MVLDKEILPNSKEDEAYDIEWRKCKKSLLYYLTNYVLIQDAVNQQLIKWQPYTHLLQLVNIVQNWYDIRPRQPCYVIIFKSRKVYATTLLSGIANWLLTFNQSTQGLELSQGEKEAKLFLNRSRFINEQHPPFLKLKAFPDQDDVLGFPATNSQLTALPSTDKAGKSFDATFVFPDEWEEHPKARDNFASVQPAMARGGLFIAATTIVKSDWETFPKEIWDGAKKKVNGFIPLGWWYYDVPGRTPETYQRDTVALTDWRKEQEYPRNEKECFSAPKVLGYFKQEILDKYLELCRDPIETRYGGQVRIWKPAITNRKDVFAVDPSEGREDPAVGIIGDATGDKACFSGKISTEEQAKLIWELYKEYNEPLLTIENNSACGGSLIEKLQVLGVKNWYYSPADKEHKKPGFHTGTQRGLMLTQHAESIHLRQRDIPIKDCIRQHYDFAWIDGKPQAAKGKHDDWVMCEAILGQGLKIKPQGAVTISSGIYRG